eukprot:1195409-Prorocentrum_minimum.AAC.5
MLEWPPGGNSRNSLLCQVRKTTGRLFYNITPFYGSSCANNGKDALNTPEGGKTTTLATCAMSCAATHVGPIEPRWDGMGEVGWYGGGGMVWGRRSSEGGTHDEIN